MGVRVQKMILLFKEEHMLHSKKRGNTNVRLFILGAVMFFVGVLWSLPVGVGPEAGHAAASKMAMRETSFSFADLAEKWSPTVVNISATKVLKQKQSHPFGGEDVFRFFGSDEFFRRFFGGMPHEREFKQKSLGSGFIISKDGYILTNNHVVENADKIKVKLSNGKEFDAQVNGKDANTDLALIKINTSEELPFVKFGDSDKLRIGEWVVAIGNPFGLDHTVTAGIVSAKGRVIGSGPYDNFIQTDASINPGNSGGPLFNLSGEVVGINTAIIAHGQGIGFAVPVNMAKDILDDLKTKGRVTRGWLGVSVQDITPDIAENLQLKDKRGALVSHIFEGEPAEQAGLKASDIILELDGKAIQDSSELLRVVAKLVVGKSVDVKILRNGSVMNFKVRVGERKEEKELAWGGISESFGMTVQEMTPDMAEHFGLKGKKGVIITQIEEGSPADDAGLKAQDIILEVNRVNVSSMNDFLKAMTAAKNDMVLLLIKRDRTSFFVTLRKQGTDD
jgi:serine protease Do